MDEDIISLLIYVALALVGIVASAFKKKKQQQQQSMSRPPKTEVPRTLTSDPYTDYGPELGPLAELFELPKQRTAEPEYETIEYGPSVEEAGMSVDSEEGSAELAGMEFEGNTSAVEKQISEVESFEEGQSDIQKMIARYDAVRKEMEDNDSSDDIARGEIVSIEAEEAARQEKYKNAEVIFDARKAIIYSEILKRKEY
jgi:hypothetical protein